MSINKTVVACPRGVQLMTLGRKFPEAPHQRLPREAYICEQWLENERRDLFGKCWTFAGLLSEFSEAGDFRTIKAGPHSLIVIKDSSGNLRGFHNLCQHRGTELLEGCGNAGRTIVCPYHNWVYNLDGALRGVPAQKDCFPHLDKKGIQLRPAAVGVFRDLVFVHPEGQPAESFDTWIDDLGSVPWPHDLNSDQLEESPDDVVYELKCNWKVFVENAIDGYHLAYLHKDTLGGPLPHLNTWEAKGRHLVWWSTERDGVKHRIPEFVEKSAKGSWVKTVKGANTPGYGGVYVLFPTTLITPNPWGFTISVLEPIDANRTLMRVRNWAPKGLLSYRYDAKDIPGFDSTSGLIKSSHWTVHPLETGDFQTEDVWVCEKMQRSLQSPNYRVGPLARGPGGEAALDFFQQCVLEYLEPEQALAAV
ncbi:MAG: aromatic ring-hydroxylating oxygenase subunit alpha [Hyphomicrobiaceae bacterium]